MPINLQFQNSPFLLGFQAFSGGRAAAERENAQMTQQYQMQQNQIAAQQSQAFVGHMFQLGSQVLDQQFRTDLQNQHYAQTMGQLGSQHQAARNQWYMQNTGQTEEQLLAGARQQCVPLSRYVPTAMQKFGEAQYAQNQAAQGNELMTPPYIETRAQKIEAEIGELQANEGSIDPILYGPMLSGKQAQVAALRGPQYKQWLPRVSPQSIAEMQGVGWDYVQDPVTGARSIASRTRTGMRFDAIEGAPLSAVVDRAVQSGDIGQIKAAVSQMNSLAPPNYAYDIAARKYVKIDGAGAGDTEVFNSLLTANVQKRQTEIGRPLTPNETIGAMRETSGQVIQSKIWTSPQGVDYVLDQNGIPKALTKPGDEGDDQKEMETWIEKYVSAERKRIADLAEPMPPNEELYGKGYQAWVARNAILRPGGWTSEERNAPSISSLIEAPSSPATEAHGAPVGTMKPGMGPDGMPHWYIKREDGWELIK